MLTSKETGQIGESIVSRYLEQRGFTVLCRNYLKKWGEIDVIASLGKELHFVEVKSTAYEGSLPGDYRPEEKVHPEKLKRMARTIQSYLLENDIADNMPWQIDVAGVFINLETKEARVRMTENIIV